MTGFRNLNYLLCTCMCLVFAHAQQTTRGKEFVLSFLPNYHSSGSAQSGDSLHLYIVATVPTRGTITMRNRTGQITTLPFTITNPAQIYHTAVHWRAMELLGYNQRQAFVNDNDNEVVARQSYRIQCDNDVTVYALNKAEMSSDATLVLPTPCLGTDYVVLSYKSDGVVDRTALSTDYTPSQFCVVAHEDNTVVSIQPSVATTRTGLNLKTATLNRGDVYLVQSEFSTRNLRLDCSGSRITASKPVAVFAGHQRARVPVENSQLGSRDCLYEQLLPTSVWGTSYVLTPLAQPTGSLSIGTDLFRVVAVADNTVIKLDGVVLATLPKNGVYEAALTKAGLLTASSKVMVALYKKTANTTSSTSVDGDPFMMVIPARRQYYNSYTFTNVQIGSVYRQQFITLIVTMDHVASVMLDGRKLNRTFTPIPGSCYAYTTISMTDGVHSVSAGAPIGLYVYGYGPADSYGYVGGMAFIPDVDDGGIDAGGDTTLCKGSGTVLRARNAVGRVRWTPSQGLSCDTCIRTTATPEQTTTYVVSGIDSSGCLGSDTVVVTVRSAAVDYSFGPKETGGAMNVAIGSVFGLSIHAQSTAWDTVSTTSLTATVKYDPSFMTFTDSSAVGYALTADWRVHIVDSLSDTPRGIIVLELRGDTVVQRDGVLATLWFTSLLGSSLQHSPELEVRSRSLVVNCVREQSRPAHIQLSTCVPELRRVQISSTPFSLRSVHPNPSRYNQIEVHLSMGFDAPCTIRLISPLGTERMLMDSRWHSAGEHAVRFDLRDVSEGMYLVVFEAGGVSETRCIVVTR